MASTRLTNNIRDALLGKLLTRAFKPKGDALIKKAVDFAERLYRDALKYDLARIDALPEGWLPTDDDIKVQLGAQITNIRFRGSLNQYGLGPSFDKAGINRPDIPNKRFPASKKGQVVAQYPRIHKLVEEFLQLQNEFKELREEIENAKRTAQGALDSVSTVKKLIEVWPEVEEFAKHYLVDGERKAVLPAIPRDRLNTILNLPPEGAEA